MKITNINEYELIMPVKRYAKYTTHISSDNGYIVKYDGSLYFIHDGDEILDGFWMTIERHWVFDEICKEDIDNGFYEFYDEKNIFKKVDLTEYFG